MLSFSLLGALPIKETSMSYDMTTEPYMTTEPTRATSTEPTKTAEPVPETTTSWSPMITEVQPTATEPVVTTEAAPIETGQESAFQPAYTQALPANMVPEYMVPEAAPEPAPVVVDLQPPPPLPEPLPTYQPVPMPEQEPTAGTQLSPVAPAVDETMAVEPAPTAQAPAISVGVSKKGLWLLGLAATIAIGVAVHRSRKRRR